MAFFRRKKKSYDECKPDIPELMNQETAYVSSRLSTAPCSWPERNSLSRDMKQFRPSLRTSFGSKAWLFEWIRNVGVPNLKLQPGSEVNALIVGGGLHHHPGRYLASQERYKTSPELEIWNIRGHRTQSWSYEPFEMMASILRSGHKPSITVADKNDGVLASLRYPYLLVHDDINLDFPKGFFNPEIRRGRDYVHGFCEALVNHGARHRILEAPDRVFLDNGRVLEVKVGISNNRYPEGEKGYENRTMRVSVGLEDKECVGNVTAKDLFSGIFDLPLEHPHPEHGKKLRIKLGDTTLANFETGQWFGKKQENLSMFAHLRMPNDILCGFSPLKIDLDTQSLKSVGLDDNSGVKGFHIGLFMNVTAHLKAGASKSRMHEIVERIVPGGYYVSNSSGYCEGSESYGMIPEYSMKKLGLTLVGPTLHDAPDGPWIYRKRPD